MKNKSVFLVLALTIACSATLACLLFSSPRRPTVRIASLRGTAIESSTNATLAPLPGPAASRPASPSGAKTSAGYLEVGFDTLSAFEATVTYEQVSTNPAAPSYAPKLTSPVPNSIKTLDRKEIAVQGFMVPLKENEGRVIEFILLKNQMMCCYGAPPKVNEWIHVRMHGTGIKPLMDQVIKIYGTIHVGEYNENRQMLGLYQLDGDGVGLVPQL